MERKLPKYCEHKSSNRVFVNLPLGPGKRKRVYLGVYNSAQSLENYDRVVGEWLATKTAPIPTNSGPTLRDVVERYRSYQEPILNQDKFYNVCNALKLLTELLGDRPAEEFNVRQFERYRSELIRRKYSREYGNRLLRIVKECCEWAMNRDYLTSDQERKIQTVKRLTNAEASTKVVGPVDDADVNTTLQLLSDDFQDMILFLRTTGCRPGEARLLQVGDVDCEHWIFKPVKHKTSHRGKSRVIPIPTSVRPTLRPRLLRPDDAFVFGADDGERAYHKRALARAIDRAIVQINCERAEDDLPAMEHWHPYQLRHTRATEVREQYGVEVAQVILGHSRIDMTQHYAGVTEEKAKEVGKLLQ
jgi:integrase